MAKKDTQAVPSARQSAQRQALKLLRRLGGLYSEMGYWFDQKTNRYIPWDTEVMRCIPSFNMDRDDNAAMVEYVASLGFSGHALSLARAIQRVYAFEDDKRLWPARSDKEGWKEMQPWVDHLRYHASVVAARCTTIHSLIKKTMLKTPLNHGGRGKRAKKEQKWDHVWQMIVAEKATKGIGKDQKIANEHNKVCAKRITDKTCERIDAEKVAQIRYEYTHPNRHCKQNHKKRS